MAERGHSLDSIKKSIEARKPDFNAYVDPQKKDADVIIQVLPTQLVPDQEGKYLRVRLIQKEGKKLFDPSYLFDEGSTISWIPCGRKLTCSFPGAMREVVCHGHVLSMMTEARSSYYSTDCVLISL